MNSNEHAGKIKCKPTHQTFCNSIKWKNGKKDNDDKKEKTKRKRKKQLETVIKIVSADDCSFASHGGDTGEELYYKNNIHIVACLINGVGAPAREGW